jgi:hypothetical protein
MKMDEFAEFVGHGASMLKHIEAGREPISDKLADKIHERTGLPYSLIFKPKLDAADLAKLPDSLQIASYGALGSREAVVDALEVFAYVLATCASLVGAGVDPKLALIPVRRELFRTGARWKLDPDAVASLRQNLTVTLFGVRGDRQGIDEPFASEIERRLKMTDACKMVDSAQKEFGALLAKTMPGGTRAQRLQQTKKLEAMLAQHEADARGRGARP